MRVLTLAISIFCYSISVFASTNSDANLDKVMGLTGAGINYATAKSLAAPCSNPDKSAWACPMMYMSYAQAAAQVMGALKAQKTATASDFNYDLPQFENDYDLGDLDNVANSEDIKSGPNSGLINGINAGLKEMETKGFGLDADSGKLKTPDGKEYKTSDFSSGQAMAGAGVIGDSEVDEVNKKINELNEVANRQYKVLKARFDTSSGAGGSGGSGYTAPKVASFDYNSLFKNNSNRGPAKAVSTAGMIKMVNGSPIGVGSDNIFDMVKRRCSEHRKDNKYIEK